MRQQQEAIDQRGLRVVAVTFEDGRAAARYVRQTGLPWPLLIDAARDLYHAYGMRRGRRRDVWGVASWKIYARLLAAGRRLRRPKADTLQLGGDVLIDPRGIVRLHHIGSGPADRPPIERLLDAIDAPAARPPGPSAP